MNNVSLNSALYSVLTTVMLDLIMELRRKGTDESHAAAHHVQEYFRDTCFSKEGLIANPDVTIATVEQARADIINMAQENTRDHGKYLLEYTFNKIRSGLIQQGIELTETPPIAFKETQSVQRVRADVERLVEPKLSGTQTSRNILPS